MCDQDHFEDDRLEYEAGGLVTRRQFGVLVAAGVALALPKVELLKRTKSMPALVGTMPWL